MWSHCHHPVANVRKPGWSLGTPDWGSYIGLMTAPTQSIETVRRQAIRTWLDEQFTFTHFITLASNSNDVSLDVMKDRLKGWDARVNRELYGPKWLKHYDELLWFFAFLEKPDVNPHWHLLCRFTDADKLARFTPVAGMKWSKMLPMGTVDVQQITEKHSRVVDYVVKRVGGEIEYRNFITPDEFRRS